MRFAIHAKTQAVWLVLELKRIPRRIANCRPLSRGGHGDAFAAAVKRAYLLGIGHFHRDAQLELRSVAELVARVQLEELVATLAVTAERAHSATEKKSSIDCKPN